MFSSEKTALKPVDEVAAVEPGAGSELISRTGGGPGGGGGGGGGAPPAEAAFGGGRAFAASWTEAPAGFHGRPLGRCCLSSSERSLKIA